MIAARIRRSVETHDWGHTAEDLAVTVSLGVAMRRDQETDRAWLDRADRALYAAKRGGRNRVHRASRLD